MGIASTLGKQLSRLKRRAWLNQGFVLEGQSLDEQNVYRNDSLELLDSYYENRQYDKLIPWTSETDASGETIPLHRKQPKIKVPLARTLASTVASKLIGPTVFPAFKVPDSPEDQDFWRAIVQVSQIQMFLLEPVRRMVNTGEIFVRFYMSGGSFKKEMYDSKFCYPTFSDGGELENVTIKYVFSDSTDLDSNGTPKRKWFRMDLGNMEETTFDNPPYEMGSKEEPVFSPVEVVAHNFGFVQGEWMTTTGGQNGYGLCADIMGFIDELSYSVSQSSRAVSYNQDPQVVFSKMTGEEMEDVIRSATKAWQLGREGEAKFLESNMSGVERAIELRDKVTQNVSTITRVVLLDPEKIVGSAQSAKAMEVLHGPLKDLVDELRLPVGSALQKLVMKMGAACILGAQAGMAVPLPLPPGFGLTTLALELKWPAIFQHTLEDTKNKVAYTAQALTAGVIGPATAVRHIAEDFGIEDIDAELADISAHQAAVAALNPFGGF